jgi:hypothetical protein
MKRTSAAIIIPQATIPVTMNMLGTIIILFAILIFYLILTTKLLVFNLINFSFDFEFYFLKM